MPRPQAPWFRSQTNSWYVTIDGEKVPLGVTGRQNRKAAMLAFAALLVIDDKTTTRARAGKVTTPAPTPSVRELAGRVRPPATD